MDIFEYIVINSSLLNISKNNYVHKNVITLLDNRESQNYAIFEFDLIHKYKKS